MSHSHTGVPMEGSTCAVTNRPRRGGKDFLTLPVREGLAGVVSCGEQRTASADRHFLAVPHTTLRVGLSFLVCKTQRVRAPLRYSEDQRKCWKFMSYFLSIVVSLI